MITLEELEAMRQAARLPSDEARLRAARDGYGLAYGLFDDLKQVKQCFEFGISLEEWASIRGVPLEYAQALFIPL
jgi:hypothetical protein